MKSSEDRLKCAREVLELEPFEWLNLPGNCCMQRVPGGYVYETFLDNSIACCFIPEMTESARREWRNGTNRLYGKVHGDKEGGAS